MGKVEVEIKNINCNLCNCNSHTLLFKARDYRFGREEEYSIVKCNNCELIYLNPRPTAESISKLYEEDYTPDDKPIILPEVENRKVKRILKKVWHRINGQCIDEIITKAKGKVLDLGCGNGYLLLPLKQKGCEVFGVETNPKSVKICKELDLKVFYGTLENAKFPDGFFDTIIMSQVIEHFPYPRQTLKEVYRVLKNDGLVLIYCPNAESYISKLFGKFWHGWHIPFHFYGFSQKTIRKLVEESGFKVEKIDTVTPDHFVTVSLKCYMMNKNNNQIHKQRPIDRSSFIDSFIFRAAVSPLFRILDFLLKEKGDCLKVVLVKG